MSTNKMLKETGRPSYKGTILIFEIAVVVSSFYYIQLQADTVAKYLGYPIAMFIVPAIVSGLIALLTGRVLAFKSKKNIKFLLLTMIMSVTPVSIFILLVNFSTGPL